MVICFRDIFDKVKADIRLMKEEVSGIERYHGPKIRSLDQYASSLEAMKTTKAGLEAELNQVFHVEEIVDTTLLFVYLSSL